MRPIQASRYENIVVLTGAGVSVASGLKPYRGPGGLYEDYGEAPLTKENLKNAPQVIWQIFNELRNRLIKTRPNRGHETLAALESKLGPKSNLTIITQNIDGLHQRAGSSKVIELHGNGQMSCCINDDCDLTPFFDEAPHLGSARCPKCSSILRPNVVLFGEAIPGGVEYRAKRALRDVDLFIAVGTSCLVSPASNFVRSANYANALTVYVNVEPLPDTSSGFTKEYIGRAEEVLPLLFPDCI